jgi:hypothetical protein
MFPRMMRQLMKMHVGAVGGWRGVVWTLAAMVVSHALAAGPSFGVLLSPAAAGAASLSLSASMPFALLPVVDGAVAFGVRVDASSALGSLAATPAVGLHATASFEPVGGAGSLYAGTGVALGRQATVTGTIVALTWTVLAGLRVPIDATWAAVVQFAAAPLLGGVGVGIGLEVTPWR